MRIEEPQRLASLRRDAINQTYGRNETLLGFGVDRQFGRDWRVYGNVSQGYRPMRYDDLGNPTAELSDGNNPLPSRAENVELGLRGSPAAGWFIDLSVFHVTVTDKIEQRLVNATDVERINSGDARHQGLEFQVEWNAWTAADAGSSLTLYANGSLLDARITRSATPALVDRTPQYAPKRILRSGLMWNTEAGGKLALSGTYVSEQFWQDSNLSSATLPSLIPSHAVWDVSGEWPVSAGVTVLAGVNNLADRVYSSRFRNDGLEVAPRRSSYVGLRIGF
jgi:Fe(3+) dicitrate transport protein